MDYTDYHASAQAETTAVSGLDADPFFNPNWTENGYAIRSAGASLPAVRGAGFAVALPNPPWRAALARRLWSIVRGAGEAFTRTPRDCATRIGELVALFEQVDASFAGGLPQAFVIGEEGASSGLKVVGAEDEQATRAANLNQWFCALYAQAGRTLVRTLLPELRCAGLGLQSMASLDSVRRATAEQQFLRRIFPVLTPLAVDPAHPFPYIAGGSTNLLFEIQTPEQAARHSASRSYARVEIPLNRPALLTIATSTAGASAEWVWTADLVRHLTHFLFPGMVVRNSYLFRVLRAHSGATPGEVEAEHGGCQTGGRESYRHVDERRGSRPRSTRRLVGPPVIRLEVASDMPDCVVRWLTRHLDAPLHGLVRVDHAQEIFGLGGLLPVAEQLWGGKDSPGKPMHRRPARSDAVEQVARESSEARVPVHRMVGQV